MTWLDGFQRVTYAHTPGLPSWPVRGIVFHTTEGSTFEGADSVYRRTNAAPHFTVDPWRELRVQHIDTDLGAYALRNLSGGVETNTTGVVQIEVVPLLSTRTMKRGDRFEIRLAEPLVIDGAVLLPAGLTGGGEVVHAAGPSIGGKPGEVILAARYLDYDGRRIPLKAMKLGRAGQDNGAASLAVSMVTPIGMFIPGGHVEIVAGSRANAKLAADIILSPLAPSTPTGAPTAGSVDSPPADTTNQDPPQ